MAGRQEVYLGNSMTTAEYIKGEKWKIKVQIQVGAML